MRALSNTGRMLTMGMLLAVLLTTAGQTGARDDDEHRRLPLKDASISAATVAPEQVVFNIHLDLPVGSRVDYLRLYYYDTSSSNSIAWITRYDDVGGFSDRTSVSSSGNIGYGTALSGYLGEVFDYTSYSYVLNWRPYQLGSTMRLCGLRIAYLPPAAASYSYYHVAGTVLRPRDSSVGWASDWSGGCLYATAQRIYLPAVLKE